MVKDFLYEGVLRRLLREGAAPATDGLAACVYSGGTFGGVSATLYEYSRLYEELKSDPENLSKEDEPYDNSILGHITVNKPYGKCEGAWQVDSIAGEGYASILYGIGYAASKNGLLMPSRTSVSPKAYNAWLGQYRKDRGRVELKSDDCVVHDEYDKDCEGRDPTPLNYAYQAYGWEVGMKKELEKQHELSMRRIYQDFGMDVGSRVRGMLKRRGVNFFDTKVKPASY